MLETASRMVATFGSMLKADHYLRWGCAAFAAAMLVLSLWPSAWPIVTIALLTLIWRSSTVGNSVVETIAAASTVVESVDNSVQNSGENSFENSVEIEKSRGSSRQELRFWQDFRFAVGCCWLWAVAAWILPFTALDSPSTQAIEDALCAMTFAGLMLAIEGRPHLKSRLRSLTLERALIRPAVIIFVIVLFVYFQGLPLLSAQLLPARGIDEGAWGSHLLRLLLAFYLALRCLQLALQARENKWRTLIGVLAVALATAAFGEILTLANMATQRTLETLRLPVLGLLPMFLVFVASAVNRHPFEPAASLPPTSLPWQGGLESSGMTLAWALSLPLVHITCYRLNLLAPELRPSRDVVTVVALVLLGSFALVQRQILDERARKLWQRRRDFQRNLRSSEADLRLLIEQGHSEREVRTSEKIFAKAFAASPDGLAISTLRDGVLLEVNPRFEEISGFSREELLGRSALSLGLWRKPSDFTRLLRHLKKRGAVRELQRNIEFPDGHRSSLRFSFDTLQVEEEVLLLTVVRPIDAKEQQENAIRHQADLLQRSAQAVVAFDSEERINLWNRQAEELFGMAEQECLGHHWSELFFECPSPADHQMVAAVAVQTKHGSRAGTTIHTISRFAELTQPNARCWISFEDEGFLL